MAQSHTPRSEGSAAHRPAAEHTPPPVPAPRMPLSPMMTIVSDRQLIEQLRQIYQTANRHLPLPQGTELTKSLEDTLLEIAGIAEKAVEGYKS